MLGVKPGAFFFLCFLVFCFTISFMVSLSFLRCDSKSHMVDSVPEESAFCSLASVLLQLIVALLSPFSPEAALSSSRG